MARAKKNLKQKTKKAQETRASRRVVVNNSERKTSGTSSSIQSRQTQQNGREKILANKRLIWMLVAAAIVIGGGFLFLRNWAIVAMVNGKPISRLALMTAMERQAGRDILDSLVTRELIGQAAQKQGVSVTSEDIEQEVNRVTEMFVTPGQDLESILALQGMTRADLEEDIRTQLLAQKMASTGSAEISDEEVASYIEENSEMIPGDMTDEEVRATAKEQLESQKSRTELQEWLANLKAEAKIQYLIDHLAPLQ